jgi:single-strand DNA-binding protein
MNNCTFIGRITKDPILRKVPVGGVETSVLNFYMAVDDGFGEYQKTDFIHVTAWRGAADTIAKYMTKGREIAVKGAVHLENYNTKNAEGKEEARACLSIPRPEGFEFLGRKVANDTPDDADCPFEEEA